MIGSELTTAHKSCHSVELSASFGSDLCFGVFIFLFGAINWTRFFRTIFLISKQNIKIKLNIIKMKTMISEQIIIMVLVKRLITYEKCSGKYIKLIIINSKLELNCRPAERVLSIFMNFVNIKMAFVLG